ncbi:SOS response-associated peptidase [Paracidovorax citrulli]
MCANYRPTQRQLLRDVFGVEPPAGEDWKPETWPNYAAPIVRAGKDGEREALLANFGMDPKGRFDTFNARSETVGERRTFSKAWRECQFCLVPAVAIYEPNYEADPKKSIRYRIWMREEPAFAVAGLWRSWPDGSASFTMLTVNADAHAVMRRMHKPGAEKRGVVILPRNDWDDWLSCGDPELARSFLRLPSTTDMDAEPDPVAPRPRKQSLPPQL